MPDTNYKHLESFVKLGTHFEPRRGEMSYICDISLLMVNKQHKKYGMMPFQKQLGNYTAEKQKEIERDRDREKASE